jgi:hypothetical protein
VIRTYELELIKAYNLCGNEYVKQKSQMAIRSLFTTQMGTELVILME